MKYPEILAFLILCPFSLGVYTHILSVGGNLACKIPDLLAGQRKTFELLLRIIRTFQMGSKKEVSVSQPEGRRNVGRSDRDGWERQ